MGHGNSAGQREFHVRATSTMHSMATRRQHILNTNRSISLKGITLEVQPRCPLLQAHRQIHMPHLSAMMAIGSLHTTRKAVCITTTQLPGRQGGLKPTVSNRQVDWSAFLCTVS